jgi:triacylglycerol lipase
MINTDNNLDLDLAAPSFSARNARALAAFSLRAYDEATISSPTEAHALVQETDTAVVVAFRGTHRPQDFVVDGEAWRFQTPQYGVHWGFWNCICSLARDVNDAVAGTASPPSTGPSTSSGHGSGRGKPLFITGHSLGGALAMLYAAKWSPAPRAVYTFGQPRVGDARFRDFYNATLGARTWRVVNEEDIVPRIPSALAGYRHAGNEAFLASVRGVWRLNPPLWLKALSDARGMLRARRMCLAELVRDHEMGKYVEALETIADWRLPIGDCGLGNRQSAIGNLKSEDSRPN